MTSSSHPTFLPNAYLRGSVLPFGEANVSIATHALHYGTAVFAGQRVEPDAKKPGYVTLFRPEIHAKRLSDSARLLGHTLSSTDITAAITKFIASNPGDRPYYLRPLVYVSDLGVSPRLHDVEYDFLIYGLEMGEYLPGSGISCCFSSWVRGDDYSVPLRGKISGTYVTSALAKSEAVARGYDEAILLNSGGKVAEGSAMNIFMVKDDVLVTPGVTEAILEGITRRSILKLAQDLGLKTQERPVDKSELLLAEEVFLTGTAARITPVTRIESYDMPTEHPITARLQAALQAIVRQESTEYATWISSFPSNQTP